MEYWCEHLYNYHKTSGEKVWFGDGFPCNLIPAAEPTLAANLIEKAKSRPPVAYRVQECLYTGKRSDIVFTYMEITYRIQFLERRERLRNCLYTIFTTDKVENDEILLLNLYMITQN